MFCSRDGRSAEPKLPLFNDGRHDSGSAQAHEDPSQFRHLQAPSRSHALGSQYQKHGCRTRATNNSLCPSPRDRKKHHTHRLHILHPTLGSRLQWISSGWRRVTTSPYPSLDESMAGRTGTKQMPRPMVHGSADLELVVFIRSSNGARTYIGTTVLALAVSSLYVS